MASVTDIIRAEALKYGVPSWTPETIAKVESGLNPNSVGDNGTSFGLFQLHRGGLAPSNMTDSQLKDPLTNTQIALKTMAPAIQRGQNLGLSGFQLLEYTAFTSAWPGNFGSIANGEKARPDYVKLLKNAYGGDTVSAGTSVNSPNLSDANIKKIAGVGLIAIFALAFIKS